MQRFLDTIAALCELARLAWVTRFRLRGPYWRWRSATAFGAGPRPPAVAVWRAVFQYARWVHRMRRYTRAPKTP